MKKILIIGAGDYQVPAIIRTRELGYEVFCVDYKNNQPGFKYANGHEIIDVKNHESCLNYAQRLNIDGVLTWGATLTLPTVSYIGENMGLPCMPMSTSILSMNKYLIRKKLDDNGLNCGGPIFNIVNHEDIKKHDLCLPFVVKPSDGSGSKGVKIVTDENEIDNAIQYAFDGARNNNIYIEPYISGEEFSVEAYVCNGVCYVYSIIKTEFKWIGKFPIYKQTTYLGTSKEIEEKIEKEVIKAVEALEINWGPVNFDLIVSPIDHNPYIIDVGIRNGQNLIASHIVPYSRGVNELDNSINLCLGQKINPIPSKREYISSRLLIYNPGIIKEIKNDIYNLIGNNDIVDIVLRKKVGETLNKYQTKSDICGWVLTKGEKPEQAQINADKAWEILKKYIIIN